MVTTTVQRELNFPPYEAVLKFDVTSPNFQKKLKRTGPGFCLLQILQKFRSINMRDPSYKSRKEDQKELERISSELSANVAVPQEYFEHVFSQISPSAAVIVGVLAQEIIKVVTKKEAPNCNIFIFDPETCCGFIETVGIN